MTRSSGGPSGLISPSPCLRSPTASPILRSAIFRYSAGVNPFSRSRIKELFAGALFPIARAPQVGSPGGHDRLERRGREKEAGDFPPLHSRAKRPRGAGNPAITAWGF